MFQNIWFWTYTLFIFYYYLHMKMKKMLIGAFLGMFALAGVAVLPNQVSAQEWSWDNPSRSQELIWWRNDASSRLLDTIKNAINWLLWILATIALAICLYAGFLMVTSAGDQKKYESGMNILKYAAIWLAVVWLSWLFVSVIFWFIDLTGWKENVVTDWSVNTTTAQ